MSTENNAATEAANVSTDGYDYGPLRTFEVTWASGHVERIQGHNVGMPSPFSVFGPGRQYWTIHGQFGKHWRCMLAASEEQVAMIRDVTGGESFGGAVL